MAHEDDSVLLAYAVAHSRTIVTFDRDFPDLLAGSGETRPSIVFLRQQGVKAVRLAEVLQALWQQHEAEIEAGCIITINTRGARVRRLPT
jgi:predicted nuclease of predicted toxin-antitoxin system